MCRPEAGGGGFNGYATPSASCHVEKREFCFTNSSRATVVDQFVEAQSQYLAAEA